MTVYSSKLIIQSVVSVDSVRTLESKLTLQLVCGRNVQK